MPDIVFETPRLLARRIGRGDVEAMLAVYGDAETVRWVDDGTPLQRQGCERWVEITLRNYASRGYGMFALEERGSGEIIGFCGLVHPNGQEIAEIKYALSREQWGKGYATEAARALLAWGFSEFGITEVIATAAPENAASHNVLLKAGLRRGELRRNDDGSCTQLFSWHAPAGRA